MPDLDRRYPIIGPRLNNQIMLGFGDRQCPVRISYQDDNETSTVEVVFRKRHWASHHWTVSTDTGVAYIEWVLNRPGAWTIRFLDHEPWTPSESPDFLVNPGEDRRDDRSQLLDHLRRDHANLFGDGPASLMGFSPLPNSGAGDLPFGYLHAIHSASHLSSPYQHEEERWTRRIDDPRGTFRQISFDEEMMRIATNRKPITVTYSRQGAQVEIEVEITWNRPDGCWVGYAEHEKLWVLLIPPTEDDGRWEMELSFNSPTND